MSQPDLTYVLQTLAELQARVAKLEGEREFMVPVQPELHNVAKKARQLAAIHFRVPLETLESEDRHEATVNARHAAIAITFRLTHASTTEFGKAFARHHVTVIHAMQRMQDRTETVRGFGAQLDVLEHRLRELFPEPKVRGQIDLFPASV